MPVRDNVRKSHIGRRAVHRAAVDRGDRHRSGRIRKPKPTIPAQKDIDGGHAWVVLVGVFIAQMCTTGNLRCLGLVLAEIQTHYSDSAFRTAWVGALHVGLTFASAPVTGFLVKKYSFRCTIMTGGFIISLAYFISYFTHRINDMYITLGAMAGLGSGLVFTPTFALVNVFFKKRRALANSIVVIGSGFGNIFIPFLYYFMTQEYGLHGCQLIMAGLFLNVCVISNVFPQPTATEQNEEFRQKLCFDGATPKTDTNIFASTPMLAALPTPTQSRSGKLELEVRTEVSKSLRKEVLLSNMYKVRDNNMEFFKRGRALRRNSSCPDLAAAAAISSWALSEVIPEENEDDDDTFDDDSEPEVVNAHNNGIDLSKFFICVLPLCLSTNAYIWVSFSIPSIASDIGCDWMEVTTFVSILGAGEIISRLLTGYVIDVKLADARYVFAASVALCGLIPIISMVTHGVVGLYILVVIYGLFGGVVFALPPVFISRVFRKNDFYKAFSRCNVSISVGSIVLPLTGWWRDNHGNSLLVLYLAIGLLVFSALFSLSSVHILRVIRSVGRRDERQAQYYT